MKVLKNLAAFIVLIVPIIVIVFIIVVLDGLDE